jgi:4'-phosphopantetheinyl transferase
MDVSKLDIEKAQSRVSQARVKKSNEFIHQKDQRLSLGAEILLNHALSKIGILDPLFETDDHGKPFLINQSVHFNLSHSEKYVACAVSDFPVGVDIEQVHMIDLDIADNYFSNSEYEYLRNKKDKTTAFFELWVLMESYMKMKGMGFQLPPDDISIISDGEIGWSDPVHGCEYKLWNINRGEYMLGLCSRYKAEKAESINLHDIMGDGI